MTRLSHLILTGTASTDHYVSTAGGSVEFRTPPRDSREGHGQLLVGQVTAAQQETAKLREDGEVVQSESGILLELRSDPGFRLRLESLERRQSGIELINVRIIDDVMHATVFVPEDKVALVIRWFERYIDEDTPSGNPKNQPLVESISDIRVAALAAFWTDSQPMADQDKATWWEVWLRDTDQPSGVVEAFKAEAKRIGLIVGARHLRFPERVVLLAYGTSQTWGQYRHLFDVLAELRHGSAVPTDYLELAPREQADFIEKTHPRIKPPPADAPAVCLLDTGVNRSHPLLALALEDRHLLTCDPNWTPADRLGHGTALAGLALYSCLTELLPDDSPVTLQHRLESVKILPDNGANDPDHYGAITEEAVARAEVESPTRNRVLCLAVTADRCDDALPTSWSAAIDQVSSGAIDGKRRLFCVAAGNIRDQLRRADYPDRNHTEAIEDPAQSWNALTIGAFTRKVDIVSEPYAGLLPVARSGGLCPTSRTSIAWDRREWPLKPDLVMEGGNTASDAEGNHASFIEDLSLLTTRISEAGALLGFSCETSAATAQVARFGAIIQATYPRFWPETVRALLVHSAQWTDRMLEEFPREERENRLRCYGYGVPDLERALWSAQNSATLIIQDALQPYQRDGSSVRTRDIHFHTLPWPVEVLRGLGEEMLRMRVTLSYFIEPSPGRRGWTIKHRYPSHGLRFDVKRPTESFEDFRQRLTRAAWDDPEERPDIARDERLWELGYNLRTKGSLHSDIWHGTAAELAECGQLAVHPITGWWRERAHLERWSQQSHYALIVSIETRRTDLDLYAEIFNRIPIESETDI